MIRSSFFRRELAQLLTIALPVMGAQLAQSGMGVIDTLMVGRLGAEALAAVALGTSIWMPLFLFMAGTLMGITPFIAQWLGKNQQAKAGPFTVQGLWLSVLLSLFSVQLMLFYRPLLLWMQVPENLIPTVGDYLLGIMLGFPALGVYQALRSYTEGLNFTRPVLLVSCSMLLIDAVANYVLIYGAGPIPAMGVRGCGLATAVAMWSGALMMVGFIALHPRYAESNPLKNLQMPKRHVLAELSKVGIPVGVAIFFEVGLFTTIALFIARLGAVEVAAHQVALNVTSVTFMVPLSLAMALTARVGYALGARGLRYARFVSLTGILATLAASLLTAGIMYFLPAHIAALYTDDIDVIKLTVTLLHLAAVFQLSDAMQVAASGALRGYKDTKVIMPITLVSYWLIGMGLGYVLALTDILVAEPLGVKGFWIGLIAGLTSAAIMLALRLRVTSQRRQNTESLPERC